MILRAIPRPTLAQKGLKARLIWAVCGAAHQMMEMLRGSPEWLRDRCEAECRRYNKKKTRRMAFLPDTSPYWNVVDKRKYHPLKKLDFEGRKLNFVGNLEEMLKNPEIKAAFDAKVQEALDAALQQPGAMEEPETEPEGELPSEERAVREMEAKEKGLAEREKVLAVREMKAAAIEELTKEQLPAALAECFSYESEETLKKSKDSVVKAFQEALKDAVNARLRRNGAPKAAEPGSTGRGKSKGSTFADIVKSQRARR